MIIDHKNENTSLESLAKAQKRNFYDAEKIKAIPIVEVCQHFGIRIDYKSREPKCSIRREDKTPSTVLHTNPHGKFKVNTYHDFGSNESGDVISLACHQLGLSRSSSEDRYRAMEYLANAFHIAPENRKEQNPGELTDREYRTIGLYGDRASKNMDINWSALSQEERTKKAQEYSITMNELKKAQPRTFERILKTVSIPRYYKDKNEYYIHVWDSRRFLRSVMGDKADVSNIPDLEERAAELRAQENALNRAMYAIQGMNPIKESDLDPNHVLEQIDSGVLCPVFGNKTKKQMQNLAKIYNTELKYQSLDFQGVYYRGDDVISCDLPYSAFLNSKGNAVLVYMEKDKELFRGAFEEFALPKTARQYKKNSTRLNDKLQDAQERQTQPSIGPEPNAPAAQR